MAVTKIWAIHDSVSRVVDYCTNPSKTKLSDLEQVLLYAISAARSKIRNKQRGCADPAERVELKKSCAACTAELSRLRKQKQTAYNMIEDNPKLKALLACELDAWVENDPYLSPREKQVLRNQQPSQEDKTIIR